MKFYRESAEAIKCILDAFESGKLPQPLSQIFINRTRNIPMGTWSFMNQFVCAWSGCVDARGFRQWKEVGRFVSQGEKARAHILIPLITNREKDNEDTAYVYGYTSAPVFDITQTEGQILEGDLPHIVDLPFLEVAESWGITVTTYSGKPGKALGRLAWIPREDEDKMVIALGVENTSTWAHELIHAADIKLGTFSKKDTPGNELVAEMGGAALLTMIGHDTAADIGGAWDYIQSWAKDNQLPAHVQCQRLLDRTCKCIDLIVERAIALEEVH